MGTPDAYEGAPLVITAFLNVIPKIPVFYIYNRILNICFYNYNFIYNFLLLLIAIISILWGALCILFQYKYIRLLTYSTIGNTGFFLLPLITNNQDNINKMFNFLIIYCIIMLGIFICLSTFTSLFEKFRFDKVTSITNLFYVNPGLAVVFATFLFSLGSIPPILGFFGKFMFLVAVLEFNLYFVGLIFILLTILLIVAYLRIIKGLFFTNIILDFPVMGSISFPQSLTLSLIFIYNLLMPFFGFDFLPIYEAFL